MATIVSSPSPVGTQVVPGSASAQRSLLVDIVKGIAIILMVIGHTNQGMLRRGVWSATGWRLNAFLYAFHMPAFFFVSGIFLRASADKRGMKRFVRNKVETVFYPFLLWALVLPLMPRVLGRWMNVAAAPLGMYLLNPLTGNLEWFLPTLFVLLILGALLRNLPMPLVFAASVALSFFWNVHVDVAWIGAAIEHLPFVVAGMWLGRHYPRIERVPRSWCAMLAFATGILLFFATPVWVGPHDLRYVPVGLLGTAMLLFAARALGTGSVARFFAWLGIGSIAIFILSPFGQGFGRALLTAMHVRQPLALLLLPSLLASLVPAWLYAHRVRWRIAWMFRWLEAADSPGAAGGSGLASWGGAGTRT